MPRVRPPQSDAGQVHLFTTSLATAAGDDAPAGPRYLPADLVTQITAFATDRQENGATIPGYSTLVARRAVHEGHVSQETGESQLAEEDLETHIRDYIVTLVRRTFRKKHPV
ncbi:MAG: hypothetical protein ACRCXD_02420, partial [Luteolibacter sp.]